MSDDENHINPFDVSRRWLFLQISQHLGRSGLLIILTVFFLGFTYWNWNNVRTLPGIAQIVDHFSRWSIPTADPNRFSILVAHLQNDASNEQEHLIIESLKECEGIQVLSLGRTIPLMILNPVT